VKISNVVLVIGFVISSIAPAVAQYHPYDNYNYCNQPQYYHYPSCRHQRYHQRRQNIRRVEYERVEIINIQQGRQLQCTKLIPLQNGLTRCFNPH
jgi:hypothetical protein